MMLSDNNKTKNFFNIPFEDEMQYKFYNLWVEFF